jgi:hypothetical protein
MNIKSQLSLIKSTGVSNLVRSNVVFVRYEKLNSLQKQNKRLN